MDVLVVLVLAPHIVRALDKVRHPSDPTFGERDLEVGCLWNTGENTNSTAAAIEVVPISVTITANGASAAVDGGMPPEPKCMTAVMLVSSRADHTGSQWDVWKLGSPRFMGLSGRPTARQPFAALRSISVTINCVSHNGLIIIGMNRADRWRTTRRARSRSRPGRRAAPGPICALEKNRAAEPGE
jgi:hypothetical protein